MGLFLCVKQSAQKGKKPMENEILTKEVFALKEKVTEMEARARSNTHRLDGFDKELKELESKQDAIYEIATSVKLLAQDMSNVKDTVNGIKKSQAEIQKELVEVKAMPHKAEADRYKHIKTKVVEWLIVFILSALAVYFGLK